MTEVTACTHIPVGLGPKTNVYNSPESHPVSIFAPSAAKIHDKKQGVGKAGVHTQISF